MEFRIKEKVLSNNKSQFYAQVLKENIGEWLTIDGEKLDRFDSKYYFTIERAIDAIEDYKDSLATVIEEKIHLLDDVEIKQIETRAQWICQIKGHSYVRTEIYWVDNRDNSISWHLNEDQKENEIYLSEEKLEELFQFYNI